MEDNNSTNQATSQRQPSTEVSMVNDPQPTNQHLSQQLDEPEPEQKQTSQESMSVAGQDGLLFKVNTHQTRKLVKDEMPNIVKAVNDVIKDMVNTLGIDEKDFDRPEFIQGLKQYRNEAIKNVCEGKELSLKDFSDVMNKSNIACKTPLKQNENSVYNLLRIEDPSGLQHITALKQDMKDDKVVAKSCVHNKEMFKKGLAQNAVVRKYYSLNDSFKRHGVQHKVKMKDMMREPDEDKLDIGKGISQSPFNIKNK